MVAGICVQKHMSSRGPWDEVAGRQGGHGLRPYMVAGLYVQKHLSSRGPWHETCAAPGQAWDESRYFVRVICGAAHEHQGVMG